MGFPSRPMDKILRRVEINQWHYGWLETCVEKHSVPDTLSFAFQRGMDWQPITDAAAAAVFVMLDLRLRMPEMLQKIQDAETAAERQQLINALLDRIGAGPIPDAGGSGCNVSDGQADQSG